jgi:small subunit ribosomal protein S1
VLKIDDTRRNIVISRRSLIESSAKKIARYLMQELEVGQVRKGIVKNIADFGAFVDLGGIDGLLHITDMAGNASATPPKWFRSIKRSKSRCCTSIAKSKRSRWV